MDFMSSIKSTLNETEFNKCYTENGALGYRTTGKNLLDINFKVASMRSRGVDEIEKMFEKAYAEDKIHALKWLFFLRDARGGLGERRAARIIMKYLASRDTEIMSALVPLMSEYGRFDDLLCLVGTYCENDVLEYIKKQVKIDKEQMAKNMPISLIAKWLPSCNASSKRTKELGAIIRKYLGMSESRYRKMLSEMRKYIGVVERKMSAGEWDKIDYEKVPSKANIIYRNAFLKHDEDRRKEYFDKIEKGEAKINSSVNFPHEIVHSYTKGDSHIRAIKKDNTLEELWKALPDNVNENGNTLFVRDGSYSMTSKIDLNSKVTALDVSTALAIYFSERCVGKFKDKFITFSSRPALIEMGKLKSLHEKIVRCLSEDDCSNTNIEATFNLILSTAIKHNMKQEDMPKNVLIVSDMEFDYSTSGRVNETLFDTIGRKFKEAGYNLPRLVFWNVNSRTGTIPVKENELGVALVSGFSTNICKMVLSGELDPYKCLIEQLDTERYAPVEKAVKDLL